MKPLLRWLKRLGILVIVLLALGYGWLYYVAGTASVSTHGSVDLDFGNIEVPSTRTRMWASRSALADSIVALFARRKLENWKAGSSVSSTRALIARLELGVAVDSVNALLLSLEPVGITGSTGPLNPRGDYDFKLHALNLLLYRFGDRPDLLYPETVDHIVDVLMTKEGGEPDIYTPRLLWLPLRDTENHILMTEGSRYLKNRWKMLHGDRDPNYDNAANGLESYLVGYLSEIERAGFHEFNARPYQGYTLAALLNLEAFADGPVSAAARRALDLANWSYALGSLTLRRYPPFRRQPRRAQDTYLDGDYQTALMKTWMSTAGWDHLRTKRGEHHALWAALLPYRPADAVARWVLRKPERYFVRMGHGADGSPEIYSGGPGYLITSGGVANDRFRQIVARPTTLMLNDGVTDVTGLLRVSGPGSRYREWNNTGVHRDFAVAAGPLTVPEGWSPVREREHWQVYRRQNLRIVTHVQDSLGLFALFHTGDPEDILDDVIAANPHPAALHTRFRWPAGNEISYDVRAPRDRWVVVTANGFPVNRDHGTWPLFQGDVPGFVRYRGF